MPYGNRELSRAPLDLLMLEGKGNFGFDTSCNTYVDLSKRESSIQQRWFVLHPENAVSVASVLLLTEARMIVLPEPKPEAPAAPDMSM